MAPELDEFGKLDYVPGLVAKALIEAVDYYQDEDFAQPWLRSVAHYANLHYQKVPTQGGSLDDLNAVKLYFPLRRLTVEGAPFADSLTAAHCDYAIDCALQGLAAHNELYNWQGGWWHKKNYINQMWCDGQYMGPALLAEMLVSGDGTITGSAYSDWDLIAQQFEMTWQYLWDKDEQLLWHAFSADAALGYNEITHAETWADPETLHSATYWGRAEGWYFMALIDVLQLMPTSHPKYNMLRGYLSAVAEGLALRQDKATGCWYQLLSEDDSFVATEYNGQACEPKANYLESSCSFLFAACYLKGARLGLFEDNARMREIGTTAFEGAIARFWTGECLVDCCASAGLGGKGDDAARGGAKMRDGSKAYYLLGYDVTRVTTYTEGKVLGAAIMAAVEYERLYTK